MGDRRFFGGRAKTDEAAAPVAQEPSSPPPAVSTAVPSGSPLAVDETCVRARRTVQGVIQDVTVSHRGDAPALEVNLVGTDVDTGEDDQVQLVWLGRSKIAGIEVGREVVASARICAESGTQVMYNPRYDLR